MLNKTMLCIVIKVAVILGIGYCAGHYAAASKAEKDIAAIRAILEAHEAEKAAEQEILEEAISNQKERIRLMKKEIGM